MQRLFTAVWLPDKTAKQLTALQPAAGAPVQLVEPSQLHITLHFIGQAETREIVEVLEQVQAPAFPLQIDRLGKFNQTRGAVILWAGVQKNEGLISLYRKIAAVLPNGENVNSSMDYVPHITIARCKNGTPIDLVDSFISRAPPAFEPFTVTGFGLYSSRLHKGKPFYRCERAFSLELP